MLFSKLIHFLDKKAILGWIISQYSGCYPTKNKKVIQKLDIILIFEKIKKLSIALGQGLSVLLALTICLRMVTYTIIELDNKNF